MSNIKVDFSNTQIPINEIMEYSEKVEKILGIIETRKKQENTLESVQRKTNEQHFTVNNNLKINI